MKNALKVVDHSKGTAAGTELIYLQQAIWKFGVDAVREWGFVCARTGYQVPMFPVIPTRPLKER